MGTLRRALVVTCLVIALCDGIQPLVLPWQPKHVWAVLGGVFYLGSALAIAREVPGARIGVAVLPVVPASVLVSWGMGVELPVAPDGPMVGVFVLQLLAAGLAVRIRRPVEAIEYGSTDVGR